ncbi:MAG: aminomethyl transferase family protein [Acidobacteria bacterium]|nr:aminomethyl transferase family protein [Acidobacteriota bacterium]
MVTEYYEAARNNAAVWEKDRFGILKLTGSERASWLQGMVTNDVQKLAPDTGCYAAHLTAQGKMVAQMLILADEDTLWLTLERAAIPGLAGAFDKLLIMEDVQIADLSDQITILSVLGPNARAVIESWLQQPVGISRPYEHRSFEQVRVVFGELGYEVWVPKEQSDTALRALAKTGAMAIDHGTWDILRTEAGSPVYGVDVDETTTLPELGEKGISYEKGCYIGQEVVAKVKYIGHVNRKFVGLVMEADEIPNPKSAIQKSGKDVGYVTTAVFSPALNKPIALGFVGRAAATPGMDVDVVSGGHKTLAKVVELPFR